MCFYTQSLSRTEVFAHECLYTDVPARINKGTEALLKQNLLHRQALHRTAQLIHKEVFTRKSFDTEKRTKKLLDTETLTYMQKLYPERLLYRNFCAREAFTRRTFYEQQFVHTPTDAFTHRCL